MKWINSEDTLRFHDGHPTKMSSAMARVQARAMLIEGLEWALAHSADAWTLVYTGLCEIREDETEIYD